MTQALLPNHWHATLSTYRQFCQITGTLLHIQETILPNHWHMRFCQFPGMLLHILAILPNHWHTDRQFCQITGTGNSAKSGIARPLDSGNSAQSLAHCRPQVHSENGNACCILLSSSGFSNSHPHPQFSVAQWGLWATPLGSSPPAGAPRILSGNIMALCPRSQ